MTSVKPVLNYRPDKDGRYTLLLQVIHKRNRGVVSTSYQLFPQQLDRENGNVLAMRSSYSERNHVRKINDYIAIQIKELWRVVDELLKRGEPFLATDVTNLYRNKCDKRHLHAFIEWLCLELAQQGRYGTARNYRSTLTAIERFVGHERCRFDDITIAFLADFENDLKRNGKQRNTITFYLRVLRAIYNKARRSGVVYRSENPFDSISFREDKTRKLAISEAVLLQIAEADNIPARFRITRDLFMFSFYARGMSFVDMAYLQRRQIQSGILRYYRRKTGQPFTVRITPPMKEILERYDNSTLWMFPLMIDNNGLIVDHECSSNETKLIQQLHHCYNNALSRHTRYLERISTILGLESKLSFNVARHSWASLARSRGIPVSVISGGLGHASEKTTNIYLDELANDRLDEANDIITKLK